MAEEGCQSCWEEIKKQTGFATYADYLESYVKEHAECKLGSLVSEAQEKRELSHNWVCFTMDIVSEANDGLCLRKRRYSKPGTSFTQLCSILHHQPKDTMMRVLWWQFEKIEDLTPELLDACGLGFKVGPRFFEIAVGRMFRELGPYSVRAATGLPNPSHIAVGYTVATFVHSHERGQIEVLPILLILGGQTRNPGLESEIIVPPFEATDKKNYFSDEHCVEESNYVFGLQTYARILVCLLQSPDRTVNSGQPGLQLLCMLPFLQMAALHVGPGTRYLQNQLTEQIAASLNDSSTIKFQRSDDKLRLQRSCLRLDIDDAFADRSQFLVYARSKLGLKSVQQDQSFIKVNEVWDHAFGEASRLEREVRDYVLLAAGQMAWLETKKSIELSNVQIREGKRITIITFLAFVYVPFNAVTSIYSMNVQEINGMGHRFWLFWLTAIGVLLLTGVSWYIIVEILKLKAFRDARSRNPPSPHTIPFRIYLVLWLIKHGETWFMLQSGAWLEILRASKTPLQGVESILCQGQPSAGEFVCELMKLNYVARTRLEKINGKWQEKIPGPWH